MHGGVGWNNRVLRHQNLPLVELASWYGFLVYECAAYDAIQLQLRRHVMPQIRVHLGHVGHPIVGDDFYGVIGPWIDRQVRLSALLQAAYKPCLPDPRPCAVPGLHRRKGSRRKHMLVW